MNFCKNYYNKSLATQSINLLTRQVKVGEEIKSMQRVQSQGEDFSSKAN